MKNIEMQIDGDILTVKIDLSQRHGKSASVKEISWSARRRVV